MKIAVYAICKNESAFAERFINAIREADYIVVVDTGSTDDTVEVLKAAIKKHTDAKARIAGWGTETFRFDHARNFALALVPEDADVCVSLDLDEMPDPYWRSSIERAWTPGTTALRYLFHWSHHPDGTPAISFWPSKVHARHGYVWRNPVHEVVVAVDPKAEVVRNCDMIVHHWPDASKSRSSYLPLLKLHTKEEPNNARAALYYGRELMYVGRHAESATELKRYLSLPDATWYLERCAAMRFIARAAQNMGDTAEALRWHLRACAEAFDQREPWVELGNFYYDTGDSVGAHYAATQALKIEKRPEHYLTEDFCWNHWPEQLRIVSRGAA